MKRKLSVITITILTAGLLSACGGSSGRYDKYMKLGDYKGVEISKIKTEVTDEDIQEQIDATLDENAEQNEITDRACRNGDMVNIDFTGTIDGEEFEGGSGEDYELYLGDGYFLEDLESAIAGMKTGEQKDITITFPEDYDEELGGKEAVFSVTLNSIYEENIPEYNDEFVAAISEFSTVEEYEEDLRNTLQDETESSNLETAAADALAEVVADTDFTGYPDELYDECKASYDEMNAMYAEMFGMDVSDLASDEEETKTSVEEMVYEKMVITAIAEKEKLEVTDDEYDEYLDSLVEEYGYDSPEDFEKDYPRETIEYDLLTSKVLQLLLDNAKITEVSEDEYYDEYYSDVDDEMVVDEDMEEIDISEEDSDEDMVPDDDIVLDDDIDDAEITVEEDEGELSE